MIKNACITIFIFCATHITEHRTAHHTTKPPTSDQQHLKIILIYISNISVHNHHDHHHLALQPSVGFPLLSQVSPNSSAFSCFFQFFIFSFFKSSITSSCHHCLGLPTGLVPIGFQSNSFPVGLARSIPCIWPSHLILCALMNLTISVPFINLSISMLFRILHILSIFIHSFSILSDNRSKASSKTIPPHSVI